MYQLRNIAVHLEDGLGEIVHVHQRGMTMGRFLKTLNIDFDKKCIETPIEGEFCSGNGRQLKFFVNGIENNEFEDYRIQDLDKILITIGKGNIEEQLASITNFAIQASGIVR